MKRNIITLAVALLILAGIVALNRISPDRLAQAELDAAQEAAHELEHADELEQQFAQNNDAGEQAGEEKADDVTDSYKVKLETTKGDVVLAVYPEWAPIGAARFKEALEAGVYDDAYFFRVIPNFVVQFGIPGDPELSAKWSENAIKDEPVKQSNKRGTVTFAKKNIPNTRTTQIFINLADNTNLDGMGFAPFAEVVEGMDVVEQFNAEYGAAPSDDQFRIQAQGNAFIEATYPNLDKITNAEIINE